MSGRRTRGAWWWMCMWGFGEVVPPAFEERVGMLRLRLSFALGWLTPRAQHDS